MRDVKELLLQLRLWLVLVLLGLYLPVYRLSNTALRGLQNIADDLEIDVLRAQADRRARHDR